MDNGKIVHFQCYYCDETFELDEKQVVEAEKIAIIKCPKCNGTDDIVKLDRK